MFDVYLGDTNLTVLMIIVSAVLFLPVQLLLCFRAKRRTLRLLPIIILFITAAVFILMTLPATGWTGLYYILFAIYAAMALFMCGLGWAIWFMASRLHKRK